MATKTHLQRATEVQQLVWSGDDIADPIPHETVADELNAFAIAYQQFWPADAVLDPDDPYVVPASMTDDDKAVCFLNGTRMYLNDIRGAWHITSAEHDARMLAEDHLNDQPSPPPIPDEVVIP